MSLLPHQVKYARGYKDKAFLVHEGGTGKTVCASVWLHDGRDADALVVCPKRVVKKWGEELAKWQTRATVVSMEDFKKTPHKKWSALVIDEADEFASPLFLKGRSQRATHLYELVKLYDVPVALLTATPVRSTPWNMHSLLCYLGIYYNWKAWREEFFSLESRPYIQWKAWFAKPDWRIRIRAYMEKYADIVLMSDCVDYLPPIEEESITVKSEPFKKSTELTPTAAFVEEHKHEQVNKPKGIIAIGKDYRKIIVVAYYVEQVEALAKELAKDRETFMVHGGTKNQEDTLQAAQDSDECFLVVQASLGVGWNGDKFSCVIFASMSYKVRDFVQIKYRVRRIHNLHPVKYIYLFSGRCDRQIYKVIQEGRDFVPSEYAT